jgi:nickel-dependent lactate racemase
MKNHRSVDEIAAKKEEDIEVEGHRAYASARMMQQVEVVMLTKMCREELEPLHFTHKNSLDEAIGYVRQKHGPDFRAYVLPKGGAIFPVVR